MKTFEYSEEFKKMVAHYYRGAEDFPNYESHLNSHLGGRDSRLVKLTECLCPEIEYHCGSLRNKRVLDFGCGTGATTVALAQHCHHVLAFDVDPEVVDISRRRILEHGLSDKVEFCCRDDLEQAKSSLGSFDVILVNSVIEHIPLSIGGLRKRIVRCLFDLLNAPGYLVIGETPNRLWPLDYHSTQLWWVPWTRPGSQWAYKRAVKKGRHHDTPKLSPGPLGLEEVGAWGATYWEITGYFKGYRFECLNTTGGHSKHIQYSISDTWRQTLSDFSRFYLAARALRKLGIDVVRLVSACEFLLYYCAVKPFRIPITAFAPAITNLIIKKCGD